MKLLFVTTEPPCPPMGGASLRAYHFIRLLAARHQVHLVCYASVRQELALRRALGPLCQGVHGVPPPPPRNLWRRAGDLALSSWPDLALRLYQPALGQLVARLAVDQDLEVVHLMGLEAACALLPPESSLSAGEGAPLLETSRSSRRPQLVLDALNAEYLLQERAYQTGRAHPAQWPGALYSWVQSQRLRRYEGGLCRRVAAVLTVAEADREALERLVPGLRCTVVPNGVDTQRYQPPAGPLPLAQAVPGLSPGAPVLLFTGTMDYRPNVDAVVWFGREVLPRVLREAPEAHLVVVGRNPAAAVWRLAGRHVTITAAVADDLPYFQGAAVFVLPMRFGGGSRLKLLQALACGLPVVTTAVGATGVDFCHEEHGLVADTREAFAFAVVRLLREEATARRLGAKARELALRYDWSGVAPRLEAFYQALVAAR